MLVASLWLAVAVAMPVLPATVITLVAGSVVAGCFWAYGAARVAVGHGHFRAGRARIALHHLGAAESLDADATRRAAGVDADARAYLLLRPYLKRAVRVEITDPADPAPYWLVSTRHGEALVRALSDRAAGARETGPSLP
jgi:hypothetical protein